MDQESTVQNFCTELFVWGNNKEWQCGSDQQDNIQIPMRIYVQIVVRLAVCGEAHTVLSTNEGQIYTFGSNKYGQLGIGLNQNTMNYAIPQLVIRLQNINCTKIAAGQYHTLSLSDDGIAYGWGQSNQGQLGTNQESVYDPIQLSVIHRFINLLAGASFSVFLKENEEILLCGLNFIDVSNVEFLTFNQLEIDFQIQDICTGRECILILSTTNELYVIISDIEKIKLPLTNIQCLYSAYNPIICLDDNTLYQYQSGKVIKLQIELNCSIVECSQGVERTLIIDENNVVRQIIDDQLQEIQELKDQDIRIMAVGYDHYIAVGQITKQNKNSFKLLLSPCEKIECEKDTQNFITSPTDYFKAIQTQSVLGQKRDNTLFSFSMKCEDKFCQTDKDNSIQLLCYIKQLEAELLTLKEQASSFEETSKENKQLKKQRSIQQKNLEFQLQYQLTLQEQIQRLIIENETQKKRLSPTSKNAKKKLIIQEIYEKQANLRGLIQTFYNDHHKAIALIRSSQY